MAERKRSHDGSRDTEAVAPDTGTVSQQGSSGGGIPREIGSRDELRQAQGRPAGSAGLQKSRQEGAE